MRLLAAALVLLAGAPEGPPAAARALAAGSGGRPTLVHFVHAPCACSVRAAPQVGRLRAALAGKVRCVAVIDLPAPEAARWVASAGLGFEPAPDPELATVGALGVTRSLTTLLLDAEGRELGRWRGHDAAKLRAAAEAAARAAGIAPPELDTRDVPAGTVAGCTFPSR